MARWAIAAGLAALLTGCGGADNSANVTFSLDKAKVDAAAPANAVMSDPLTASGGSNDCAKNPDFAPIYGGATPTVCSSTHFGNTGKDAGSFHYNTDAAPAVVLAYAKEQAAKFGLTARISTDTMFSAGEGNTRTFMTIVQPEGSGSKVTVNWGVVR